MGKYIISGVFLVFCGVSLLVFFVRDDKLLKEQVNMSEKLPRIILEDFTLYKYREHSVKATFTGKIAHFRDPNILEVYGEIRGLKHNSEKREHISAESATVVFHANGIVQLLEESRVKTCEIENNVQVGSGNDVILTQYAQYSGDKNHLRSDVPVKFSNPTAQLKGKNGFVYDIETGDLELIGPIEGFLQGETRPDL